MPLQGEYIPGTSDFSTRHVEQMESTGAASGRPADRDIVIVTMVGAKSGALRKVAVMRVEHDGEYAVVASLGGAPEHPKWYRNIIVNPRVELQDGESKHDYLAREVDGAERDEWWTRAVAAYPPYAEYQTRTDRVIPVFVLTRAD